MAGGNSNDNGSANARANSRLQQVASHLQEPSNNAPSSSKDASNDTGKRTSRRRQRKPSGPPADYSDVLSQLETLRTLAREPDTSRSGYVRQKEAGKLWVRERVEALLDKDSFEEVGSVAGEVEWQRADADSKSSFKGETPKKFTPSNNVQGYGRLGGRRVVLTADDYSLRAGHADGALWSKTEYLEKLSYSLRLPILKLVDGSSGGGSVTLIKKYGFSAVPPLPGMPIAVKQVNAGIPNLGAVLGPAIGLGAARVTLCHFSVMAANVGSLFNAGPAVVAGATMEEGLTPSELGGPDMHCRNGTIDNVARNEEDAFRQLRTVLSYLPNSGSSAPPVQSCNDPPTRTDDKLRSIIPRRKERMYDPRYIITSAVDRDSFFEIGALWGTTTIVGLARLGGRPVGIISNNCEVGAGALDAAGSQKLQRHLKLCDVMNLPVVQFVDVPGYAVGTVAERTATMRHGANLVATYFTTTMPVFSVIVRRAYGVAGGAMLDCRDPRMRVAWPSGDWGSLPLEGGIEVGHRAQLRQAAEEGGLEKGKELYESLKQDYERLQNPVRTANAFSVEEIIDPAQTRPTLCQWAELVYADVMAVRLADRAAGKISPQFA